MNYQCGAGTPNHMEIKLCSTPSEAKTFLRGRIDRDRKFAVKFNAELDRRLGAAREEIRALPLASMNRGDHRSWHAVDEPSQVQFTYEIRVQ